MNHMFKKNIIANGAGVLSGLALIIGGIEITWVWITGLCLFGYSAYGVVETIRTAKRAPK